MLIKEASSNGDKGLIIVEKNKYDNIAEVTHTFCGNLTIEEAMRDIIISKLQEKKMLNNNIYDKI